jgi:hypothetical protein
MPGFIMVPVPEDRVMEVYALLGRDSKTTEPEPPAAVSVTAETGSVLFDPDLVTRAYRESPPGMKAFLDYLADRSGEKVSSRVVGKDLGYTWNQVAGMLGAFGRRWRNRYGQTQKKWLFEDGWNFAESHQDYRMPENTARVIQEARNGS